MLIVIALIVAFVLVAIFSNRRTRNCRWRADRRADSDGRRAWRCAACGARAFTTDDKPPQDCAADPPQF